MGAETLTMALDLDEALESLADVPDRLYAQVEAMEELARTKSVRFAYESLSWPAPSPPASRCSTWTLRAARSP